MKDPLARQHIIRLLVAPTLVAITAGGAHARKIHPPPYSTESTLPEVVEQWFGRESEALELVKNYEPPRGEGTLASRVAALTALAENLGREVLTVNDWGAEHRRGPLYVVSYEVKTEKGWRTFAFKADLSRSLVEPITPAADVIWRGEGPKALTAKTKMVIKPASPEAAASPESPRPPEEIEEVIASFKGEFTDLYKDRLKTAPDLAGRVLVSFTVAADGRVADAVVLKSDTGDADFDETLAELIKTFNFGKTPGGDVEVIYPFLFSAAK